MKINPSGRAGFTLTEVMIVAGIVGLLAEIAIPNFLEARRVANGKVCINNIRQIDAAKQQWALEELRASSEVPLAIDLAPYLGHGDDIDTRVVCPLDLEHSFDTSYSPNDLITPPECRKSPSAHILPFD